MDIMDVDSYSESECDNSSSDEELESPVPPITSQYESSNPLYMQWPQRPVYPESNASSSEEEPSSSPSPTSSLYDPGPSFSRQRLQSPTSTPRNQSLYNQTPTSKVVPSPSSNPSTSPPLQPLSPLISQIKYRNYKHPITLYHYNIHMLPIRSFLNSATKPTFDYIHSLTSHDALANLTIAAGDETPATCIEVVYLPKVFRHRAGGPAQGCAIGLRYWKLKGGMQVEWLCFRKDARGLIEGCRDGRGVLVFDDVGVVERGGGVGSEHREWWGCLDGGRIKDVRLRVVNRVGWGMGRDGDELEEDRDELLEEEGDESLEEDGDESLEEDGDESLEEYGDESLEEDNEDENDGGAEPDADKENWNDGMRAGEPLTPPLEHKKWKALGNGFYC